MSRQGESPNAYAANLHQQLATLPMTMYYHSVLASLVTAVDAHDFSQLRSSGVLKCPEGHHLGRFVRVAYGDSDSQDSLASASAPSIAPTT